MSFKLGKEAKVVLANEVYPDNCAGRTDVHLETIDLVFSEEAAENRLIHSINEMDSGLKEMGIQAYDLDDLAPILLEVYDYQQQKFNDENVFSLISLVGMALLELGVIIECDEEAEQLS